MNFFVNSLEQTRFDINKSKNWARANRKTLKCPKMNSKSKLRNLILKISDLQNIFYLLKDLIFKLNRNIKFVKRNDKMACNSKSKAF